NLSLCTGSSTTISATGGTLASGLTYQWQESPDGSTNWVNAAGTSDQASYTTPPYSADIYYRLITTCTASAGADTTNVVAVTAMALPPYVAFDGVSYTEDFEAWASRCGTNDSPGANWLNTPSSGLNSWRRDDQGA